MHHYHHYASVDLVGLAAAAFASWFGIPGPGEPVLVAAGVLAGQHHLSILAVLIYAFIGAALGGIAGWAVGMKAGRRLLTRPGPLLRLRLRALERGEQVFQRAEALAVFLTPSWVAGIHRARFAVVLPVNLLGAALWAGGIGLGAYYAGPPVLDAVGDVGTVMAVLLLTLIVLVVGGESYRRYRAVHRRSGSEPTAG